MKLVSRTNSPSSFGALHPLGLRESTGMSPKKTTTTDNDHAIISPAGALVLEAGDRIQLQTPIDDILKGLKCEAVNEIWQLEHLDSYQWESLGAPMGLVTSVRSCLEERTKELENNEKQQADRQRPSPTRGSKLQRASARVITTLNELVIVAPPVLLSSQVSAITAETADVASYYENKKNFTSSLISTMDEVEEEQQQQLSPTNIRMNMSPIRSAQDESVDTFFPPPMPERKISRDPQSSYRSLFHNSCCMETAEDHWKCASEAKVENVLKTPPIIPTRLASERGPMCCNSSVVTGGGSIQ